MKNLLEKYGITREELKAGIDIVSKNLGKICNVQVLIAVTDLLCSGDIKGDPLADYPAYKREQVLRVQAERRAGVAEHALECLLTSAVYDGEIYEECDKGCNECEHQNDKGGCIAELFKLALANAEEHLKEEDKK